jgi:hypothetical protein
MFALSVVHASTPPRPFLPYQRQTAQSNHCRLTTSAPMLVRTIDNRQQQQNNSVRNLYSRSQPTVGTGKYRVRFYAHWYDRYCTPLLSREICCCSMRTSRELATHTYLNRRAVIIDSISSLQIKTTKTILSAGD